jgi:hypothetical protein
MGAIALVLEDDLDLSACRRPHPCVCGTVRL